MKRTTNDSASKKKLRSNGSAAYGCSQSGVKLAGSSPGYSRSSSKTKGSRPVNSTVKPVTVGGAHMQDKLHQRRNIILVVIGFLLILLGMAYTAGVVYFSGHFYPNTTLGSRDISFASAEEVALALNRDAGNYELAVSGFEFSLTVWAGDIDFEVDSTSIALEMLEESNPWAWPIEIFLSHDIGEALVGTFNETLVTELVTEAVQSYNEATTASVDATIAYSENEGAFVIVEESLGRQFNVDEVVSLVIAAITHFEDELELTEDQLIHPSVTSDDERLQTAVVAASTMLTTNMVLTINEVEVATLNGSDIVSWISLDESYSVVVSVEQLSAWVQAFASQVNTVGTTRTYTRPDGKTVTVSGGVYGWSVDEESLLQTMSDGILAGSQEIIETPFSQTAEVYNGIGEADWGDRYLDIDLTEQYVRLYENGEVIWESDCISGVPNGTYDTSVGVFILNNKESPSTLKGYEDGELIYETDVSFWMAFDRNVIGLHDATWQSSFGGTLYQDGYGSHGCVNLPYDAAAQLYELIQIGDVVISHY